LRAPAAIVTVVDPETGRRQLAQNLHNRFGLTGAETGLAAEMLKGDGLAAAARRRGRSRRPARNSPAFLKRPEPIGRPNSSISCTNSRTKEIRENGRSDRLPVIGHGAPLIAPKPAYSRLP